ncbi:hypothetical protein AAC387_Pa07g1699 [Persea americana]
MAEAAVSAVISVLFKRLASPSLQKIGSFCGVKKDLNNLHSMLTAIQAVLEDAEEQKWTNNRMKNWLGKLKDVAYDIEDILDELATEDLRWRVEIHKRMINKVRNFFSPSNPIAFYFKMAPKVRKVVDRLDAIAKERSNFNLSKKNPDSDRDAELGWRNQTHSFIQESDVFGREEDREKLVQMLTNIENEEDVSVVPIVGMGGLGKTTLAKLVYNDARVKSYFDQRMWAFVSEKFNMADIMKAIIASTNEERCDLEHMDPLQSRLRQTLHGKKYLLVLDDVWNENQEEWLQLKTLLMAGVSGSKIIVTTRSEIVGYIMGTSPTYYLRELPEKICWSLFNQRAFPKRDEEKYPNLLSIGKEIVKKCKGVPLAANALGGLLHSKRMEREWLSIRDNEIWKLNEDHILSTLRLSYNALPSPLKQCFAYCSIFPKGRSFEKNKLIQLWVAEGFIQSSREGKLIEDIAAQYFDELRWRSFFQEAAWRFSNEEDGKVFKMHDLINDLARSIAGTECLVVEAGEEGDLLEGARHASFVYKGTTSMKEMYLHNSKKLRTYILINRTRCIVEVPDKFIVGKQRGCKIEELQGLNLRGGLEIEGLEKVLDGIDAEKANLKEKQHLRKLSFSWNVADDLVMGMKENFDSVIEGLQPHPNLQCLHISNYMGVGFPMWLMDLRVPNLVEISLFNCSRCKTLPQLAQLRFLKVLDITYLPELEIWPSGESPSIQKLTINGCPKLTHMPNLPSLTMLELVGCKEMLLSFVASCPLLDSLCIGGFPELTSFPEGLFQNKSLLKSLEIWECPKLKSLPKDLCSNATIERLELSNCNEAEYFREEIKRNFTPLKCLGFSSSCIIDE